MNVLTLNTHSWMEKEQEQKLEELANFIADRSYELIALQEVNQLLDSPLAEVDEWFQPVANQLPIHTDNFAYRLTTLLRQKGLFYYWSYSESHVGYDIYAEGSAILSKQPIKAESILVSSASEFSNYLTRKLLIAHTTFESQKVCAVSCHFSWWQDGLFQYEWDQTRAFLAEQKEPVILLGDFNNAAHVVGEGYTYLKETTPFLKDSFVEATDVSGEATVVKEIDGWEGNQEGIRIDYIFASEPLVTTKHAVVFNGMNGPVVSDHYGIEIQLVSK